MNPIYVQPLDWGEKNSIYNDGFGAHLVCKDATIGLVIDLLQFTTNLCQRFLGPQKANKGVYMEELPIVTCASCFLTTQRIHVWYMYLHLVDFYGKCRYSYTIHGSSRQEKHPYRWRRRGFRRGSCDGWRIWRCRKGRVSEQEGESYCINWEMLGTSLFNTYTWLVVSNMLYFYPYLGKWSNLMSIIFQMGCFHHQLDTHYKMTHAYVIHYNFGDGLA